MISSSILIIPMRSSPRVQFPSRLFHYLPRQSCLTHNAAVSPRSTESSSLKPSVRWLSQQKKRARPKSKGVDLSSSLANANGNLPYGLTRVDYSHPPPFYPLPPPPPPRQSPVRRHFGTALSLLTLVGGIYIYFHQDEGMYEYWRQVEQGNVPIDDEEEDWDDDEEGDEWEDDEE